MKSKVIYKTKNISSFKIKGYEFKADLDQPLLKKHLKALGLKAQAETVYELHGEFSIEWDDDIPMPTINSLWIVNPASPNDSIELDLDRCFNHKYLLINGYDLEDILNANGDSMDWTSDRLASIADRDYDDYRDSFLIETKE